MNCENCEACKTKQEAESIPFIAHESVVATLERTIKRLWILALALIFLLVGTNCAWLWWSNQWETAESWEIMQENDGGYNNYIGNDGDIVNGETDNQKD